MQEQQVELEVKQDEQAQGVYRTYEKPKLESHDSWKAITGLTVSV